ncbi:MAG: response regulator transcription factor [Polyangiaceae bacterium]|nr:response regulator transcription factor [Polyangiaceae bacterium]
MSQAPAPSKHILVVEDDPSIALGLELNLQADGYAVTVSADGEQGFELARTGKYDLLILDVMLPKRNGFEILRELSQKRVKTPVIMLSARGAELDKVMGLELGAEDYVTKPFGLAELLARVRKVLKRGPRVDGADRPFSFGVVEVDPGARAVTRAGVPVDLTATEYDIMMCLVAARGRVLSRDQIQAAVWGENHHGTRRTIDNFVLQLRQKLEPDQQHPRHIVTVRGVGYRFSS